MPKEWVPPKKAKATKVDVLPPLVKEPDVIFNKDDSGPSKAGWHSGLSEFLRCPKAYQYEYIRGLHKPRSQTPDHFALGGMFHAMRARWFASRFAPKDKCWDSILDAARQSKEESQLPISVDAERRALQLMEMYMEHYLRLPRPDPVAAEYLLGPSPIQKDDPFQLYRTARLDDLSRYPEAGGKLCLGESKTTSGSPADVLRQYELHGQPLLQLALYRMCPNGEAKFGPAAGIMLDVSQKPYEGKPAKFARFFVQVKPFVIDWYVESVRAALQAMSPIDWDSEPPRNVTGCTYMAGRARIDCTFKALCMHGKTASLEYVTRDGRALSKHVPSPGKKKMPWE